MITSRRPAFFEPNESTWSPGFPPQRFEDTGKLTLVLDMDETLLHSVELSDPFSTVIPNDTKDETFVLKFADGSGVRVQPRPFLREFLFAASERYELIVFTAGSEEYANLVLDLFDPSRTLFRHRLFRQHCTCIKDPQNGSFSFLKDLKILNRDLRRTVCVDNMVNFILQIENGIPIPSFFNNPLDSALMRLRDLLLILESSLDVRKELARIFKLTRRGSPVVVASKSDIPTTHE